MRVKFCGLCREEDVDYANRLRPDYVGFVFAPGRRRTLTPNAAAALREKLAPGIVPVGVFVNQPPEEEAALVRQGVIEVVQLHGNEPPEALRRLRTLTPAPVWQAFAMAGEEAVAAAMESEAELVLLDGQKAGSGQPFHWQRLLPGVRRPYLLAGGLTPRTVGEAVRTYHPYGVDVSSGIETDGRKDFEKMKAFLEAVKQAGGSRNAT